MRNHRFRSSWVLALALLPACLGSLGGCGADKSDGSLEEPEIGADQKAEVKAQYQKQILARQAKAKKARSSRR